MSLSQLDTQLFYWINQHHCPLSDWVLWAASQPWCWAVVIVLFFCFTTLRNEPKRWWLVLLGIGLCFLLSDRISVLCFKNVFCRLRPCHALEGVRMFHTTCGGSYGFVSSHAANVFAIALFLTLRYRSRHNKACRQHSLVPLYLFLWATVVGYSRPYLGKHYPGDVICGALLGLAVGFVVYAVTLFIENKITLKNNTPS